MQQLDENFLDQVGLGGMPADKKQAFLKHAQDELEYRIGEKMSEGLSEETLEQFDHIIAGDNDEIEKFLAGTGYEQDQLYKEIAEKTHLKIGSHGLRNEYAAARWLGLNRPNFQQIVEDETAKLTKEIADNKDAIAAE